ncbi:hypothetical protein KAU33_09135 [Candidatus Dependentiae bacterium]|nr:hypothetical protein [Candidatus Dependentiae bacterium]
MLLGQIVVHRYSNEGIGVILQRDTDNITAQFESGAIITSTPELIIELTSFEARSVQLDSNNIRITNERIKKMRLAEAEAKRLNNMYALVHLGNNIKRLKRVVKKDYDFLKNTFGIDYQIHS